MGKDSTIISGDVSVLPCVKQANILNLDVYRTNDSFDGIHPDLLPILQDALSKYERNKNFEVDNLRGDPEEDSGFSFNFYEPIVPEGKSIADVCPPVLYFRGSETAVEDFRGLAFQLKIKLRNIRIMGVNNDVLGNTDQILETMSDLPIGSAQGVSWLAEKILPDRINALGDHDLSFSFGRNQGEGSTVITDMAVEGMEKVQAFKMNNTANITIMTGPMGLVPLHASCEYDISGDIFYNYLGDWGANVYQGLGATGRQYELAMKAGLAAAKLADEKWGGRLMIMGHSLGGGLASAAAAVAKNEDSSRTIIGRTYNAAGLNENTTNFKYDASIYETPTRCFSVKDEILTTAQSFSGKIPFLDTIFRWSSELEGKNIRMPSAQTSIVVHQGISPGAPTPKGDRLPILFPLNEQTLAGATPSGMPRSELEDLYKQAFPERGRMQPRGYGSTKGPIGDPSPAGSELSGPDVAQPVPGADGSSAQETPQETLDAIEAWKEKIENEMEAYTGFDNFPHILALNNMSKSGSPDDFVHKLLGYIMTGQIGNGSSSHIYRVGIIETGLIGLRVRNIYNEAMNFVKVGAASGMYHTSNPVAFTYMMDE